jgi:hypothetical protein
MLMGLEDCFNFRLWTDDMHTPSPTSGAPLSEPGRGGSWRRRYLPSIGYCVADGVHTCGTADETRCIRGHRAKQILRATTRGARAADRPAAGLRRPDRVRRSARLQRGGAGRPAEEVLAAPSDESGLPAGAGRAPASLAAPRPAHSAIRPASGCSNWPPRSAAM